MKLRRGEILLGVASIGLIVVLFLNWFQTGASDASGWSGLSLGVVLVLSLAIALAGLLVVAVQRGNSVVRSVVLSVVATTVAIVAAIALIIDVISVTGGDTDARWPAVAGILFAVVLVLGAWRSMGDERIDAPDSVFTPPEPRPIPEA